MCLALHIQVSVKKLHRWLGGIRTHNLLLTSADVLISRQPSLPDDNWPARILSSSGFRDVYRFTHTCKAPSMQCYTHVSVGQNLSCSTDAKYVLRRAVASHVVSCRHPSRRAVLALRCAVALCRQSVTHNCVTPIIKKWMAWHDCTTWWYDVTVRCDA